MQFVEVDYDLLSEDKYVDLDYDYVNEFKNADLVATTWASRRSRRGS